jgi:hypothetical protein
VRGVSGQSQTLACGQEEYSARNVCIGEWKGSDGHRNNGAQRETINVVADSSMAIINLFRLGFREDASKKERVHPQVLHGLLLRVRKSEGRSLSVARSYGHVCKAE